MNNKSTSYHSGTPAKCRLPPPIITSDFPNPSLQNDFIAHTNKHYGLALGVNLKLNDTFDETDKKCAVFLRMYRIVYLLFVVCVSSSMDKRINPLQDVMFNVYRPCNMAATKKTKPIRKGFAHRNGIASTWGFTNQKSIEPSGFHPEGILNKDGVGRGVYQTDGLWDFARPSQMTWWRNYPRFWIWRRFSLFEVMSTVRLCASFYGHIASTSFACRRQVSVGWICQRTISDEIGILLSYKFLGVCNEIEYSFPPQDRVWLLSYFISIRIFAPPNLAHCWWSFFALWTWKNMTWTSYFIWCVCASWMHTRFADYSLSTGRGWSFPSVLNG